YIHYPKSLLRAQNGTNWILGDMGLYEIIQQNDSLVYQQHLTGAAKFEDDKIYYGKNLYEDRQGSLWIGAIRDIYTYEDGKLYSYPQDSSFQTEDFDHAYAFAEDKRDVLWAANYNGFLGYYDERQDQWTWLDLKLPLSRITSLLYDTTQHSLYLGASEGVYQFDIASQELHPIYEGNPVLCMATQNTHLWWGDNRGEIMNYSLATKQKNKAAYLGNVEISCFFEIGDGNLWFGSNNGLGMVYEQAFSPLRPDDREEDLYIESIQAHNGDIYFCDRYRLYRQDATGHVSVLLNDPVSYLTSISFIGDTLWLSSRNGPRIRVNGQFQWVEQVRGDFFYTLSDQHQQLWVCHMDQSGISRYDGSLLRRTLLAPTIHRFHLRSSVKDQMANSIWAHKAISLCCTDTIQSLINSKICSPPSLWLSILVSMISPLVKMAKYGLPPILACFTGERAKSKLRHIHCKAMIASPQWSLSSIRTRLISG
ncbi:MAG: two-component regulator propeller domain-containing protein, partial [Bacteroidota bacterium]